jgi:hypothetical protein
MRRTIQRLANVIEERKNKISLLDKIAFSIEIDFQRKQEQVQELISQRNRIEKLIANTLNGEGYSKLKQIVKENVKAVLSDNKIIISTAFAAIIQTLKADPEMVKLIQNIPISNDSEQHKDDDNNSITKHLKSNNDNILRLTKKHDENLVEILTNNAIDNSAASSSSSSSNPTLPLASSSSTFPSRFDQIDIYEKRGARDSSW